MGSAIVQVRDKYGRGRNGFALAVEIWFGQSVFQVAALRGEVRIGKPYLQLMGKFVTNFTYPVDFICFFGGMIPKADAAFVFDEKVPRALLTLKSSPLRFPLR